MIARANASRTNRIACRDLEQFPQSIKSWKKHGREAGRDGDAELAAAHAEDMADLRAILRLIETGALHEATETIDCRDTLVRDQLPQYLYEKVVQGN